MTRRTLITGVAAACARPLPPRARASSTGGPFSTARNFAVDLMGVPDDRPGTWGCDIQAPCQTTASTVVHEFQPWRPGAEPPPSGHRVRVLRVYGDVVAWPQGVVEQGRFAGILWSLHSGPWTIDESVASESWVATADGQIERYQGVLHHAQDQTLAYLQDAVAQGPRRLSYDLDVAKIGLLDARQTLGSKLAVWMNSTGRAIHIEATINVIYRYDRID